MAGTVTTQVVADAAPQTFSAQYIHDMSTVDQYKSVLSNIVLYRQGLITGINKIMGDIQSLYASHQGMLDFFKNKVLTMHPEYQGQDLKAIIRTKPANDPLVQMWKNFSQNINDLRNVIVAQAQRVSDMEAQDLAQADAQAKLLSDYDAFVNQTSTPVPTSAQLLSLLPALSAVPVATTTSLIASMPAIELLSPEAAAAVTLQVAQSIDQAPVNLAVAVQDTVNPAQVAPTASAATGLAALMQHPAVLIGGALLAAVTLFGGKKTT